MANYDEEIQRILSQGNDGAEDDLFAARMGAAGNTIGQAFAGGRADNSFYDQMQASALNRQSAEKDRKMKLLSYLQGRDDKTALAENRLEAAEIAAGGKRDASTALASARAAEAQKGREFTASESEKRRDHATELAQTKAEAKANKTPAQSRQQVELAARGTNINTNIDKLKELIKEDGTFEAMGPHNQTLAQAIQDIAVDYAKMVDPDSVARESEVESAKQMLNVQGLMVRNSTALKTLDQFRNQLETRINSRREAQGLEPVAYTPIPAGGFESTATAGGGVPVRIRAPNGETRLVQPGSIQKYIDMGGVIVE